MKYILILFFFVPFNVLSQSDIDLNYLHEKDLIFNRNSMYVLGGWATANIITGSALSLNATGVEKEFYKGNAIWNTVNLSLAITTLIGNSKVKPASSFGQYLKNESSFQTILAFNAGLDLGYMALGYGLTQRAQIPQIKNANQLKGYGQALIVQGAFLLVYDAVVLTIRRKRSKKLLNTF